jgi:tetratricopeptide (TPR) repeat protein
MVPLLADLLSLPVAAPYTRSSAPLRTQRERIMRFFVEQLAALAADRPALIVIEDLHWCDPTTLELLSRVIADPRPAAIFLLLTTRPEFRPPWPESTVPGLRLAPLADTDIREMIGALAPEMPPETARRIVARADGIPLFAEELARTTAAAGPNQPDAIPATLQDLLAARLDSMAEAKGTAQLAATIGRDFPLALLRELSPLDEAALRESLCRLRETGLVTPMSDDAFQFRHALFQEAAYRSQTKADRTVAHRRIAEMLEAQFPETVRTQPETLARHWATAAEAETAIGYWLQAGRIANLRCAHKEAISHFTAGLALAETLPDEQQRIQWEFELQIGLGAANFAAEGYGSAPGGTAYARAVDLGERHTGNPDLFPALWGYWACSSSRADYDESLTLTLRLLDMAGRSGDLIQLQQGHFAVGNIRFWRGEFVEARRHLEQAMALYRPEHHEPLAANFGENAYATSGGYLCCVLAMLGLPEQALAVRDRTLAEARRIDHPFSLGYALIFATILECILRRPREALSLAEETITLAEHHGFPLWDVGATSKKGWALARLGHAEGAELARYGAASVPTLMSGIRVIFMENLADTLCHLGRHDEALSVIAEARDVMERINDRHVEAELHRLEGECLRGVADTQAEVCFERALRISRKQGARLQELRAATSLAALWRDRERGDDARHLLADICESFTEGRDMADLVEARRLLNDL